MLQNLHTHTKYFDGADTPEEMILAAMEKGFQSIGFSEHTFMTYSSFCDNMTDRTLEYKKEVFELKEKYKDQIKVYCGLEADLYHNTDLSGYDYLIGSVHYVKNSGRYIHYDTTGEALKKTVQTVYDNDGLKLAADYYSTMATLWKYGNFDIIGHFDIIAKQSENGEIFDPSSKEYLKFAFEAIGALKGKIPLFEVNTGAIARGYRKNPYPSIPIIKEFKRQGFGVVITSDCHNKNFLDCYFKEAAELLKECGYKEKYVLTDSGFTAVSL